MAKRVDTRFEASENVSKAAAKAAGGVTGLNKTVKDSQKIFRNTTIAIGAAVTAIYGAARVVGQMVEAYKVQEKAETKLQAALKATGGAVGITKEEMIAYAKELQGVTTFGDELVINAQALMTTFTQVGKEVFPLAIEAAADMSTMFGQDLQQSVIQLGTALNDPIQGVGRLRRIGISFTQQQKEQIRVLTESGDVMGAQAVILEELEREFGGVARAVGERATSALEQLNNAWSDLNELGGETTAEVLAPMARGLTTLIEKYIEARTEIKATEKALREMAEGGVEKVSEKQALLAHFEKEWKSLGDEIKEAQKNLETYGEAGAEFLGHTSEGIEILKEEQAAIARRITQLRSQIQEEGRLREEQDKSAQEEAKRRKAEEEAAFWTDQRIRIQGELADAFALIDEKEKLWGESIDVTKEKHEALTAALNEMIDLGFTAGGAGIQRIIYLYGEWRKGTGEVEETIIPMMDAYGRVVDQAAINLDNFAGMEERAAGTFLSIADATETAAEAQEDLSNAISGTQMVLSQLSSISSQISENRQTALENEYEQRKAYTEANIKDEEGRAAALKALDEEYDTQRTALMQKQARADKAASLFAAVVNTAEGITEALSQARPILAALIGVLGGVQIAAIASEPIPKFASGVRDFVVPPGYPNDSYPIMVESGERVNVAPAAAGGSSEIIHNTVILDGRVIADYITKAIRDRQIIVASGSVRP